MTTVDILLATYNGSKFLRQQIDSIKHQSHSDWRLLIRDDGSHDKTLQLVNTLTEDIPQSVSILNSDQRLGVVANFSKLLEASSANYIMFSDQDDVWHKEKVAMSLEAIKKLEALHGNQVPLLVHTDLEVVDVELQTLSTSFWRYAKLFPEKTRVLNRLLVQNAVTGCAMICNRALVKAAYPIPPEAIMHDWWMALVASAFGYVEALPIKTIKYRQHASNALGANKFGTLRHLKKAWERRSEMSRKKHDQAYALLNRYGSQLPEHCKEMLEAYLSLNDCSYVKSRAMILKHGFAKQGLLRQLAAFLLLKQP